MSPPPFSPATMQRSGVPVSVSAATNWQPTSAVQFSAVGDAISVQSTKPFMQHAPYELFVPSQALQKPSWSLQTVTHAFCFSPSSHCAPYPTLARHCVSSAAVHTIGAMVCVRVGPRGRGGRGGRAGGGSTRGLRHQGLEWTGRLRAAPLRARARAHCTSMPRQGGRDGRTGGRTGGRTETGMETEAVVPGQIGRAWVTYRPTRSHT